MRACAPVGDPVADGRGTLAAGAGILALLGLLAAAAPVLASGRPWLARVDGRLAVRPPARVVGRAEVLVPAPVPYDPDRIDLARALEPPGPDHPLGTDAQGRDVASRLLHGGRRSLAAGAVATALALAIGAALGTGAGILGPAADTILARAADAVHAFPALVGAIALLGFGGPGGWPAGRVGVVIGLFAWPTLFRYVRAEVRRWSGSDLAAAARASGAGPWRIGLRHLLPHALTPALVPASFLAGGAVLVEAGLGFLGLGIRPPEPSWGNLLRDGMLDGARAWWLALFPGLAVFLTVLGFHLLAEGLRRRLSARDEPSARAR
ncbi:MAG: ABC transporter permease [Acidobacteria bacterium]|nr:MAG: ABC transporter permease [Acidobacteriota bacterium]